MKTTIQATRSPVQWHVGMLLEAGQQVRTGCGRLTSPFPTVLVGGRWRGTKGHPGIRGALRAVDHWLIDNAATIAAARGNDFARRQFQHALDCRVITPADLDSAELYLSSPLPGEILAAPCALHDTATV